MLKPHSYIAIEGVVGSGKTEMAKILSRRLNSRLILDNTDDNPFLRIFYDDIVRYRFQTQICFLLNRYRQLQEVYQVDLFHQGVVSDYHFLKDKIFAYLNLDDDELSLYEKLVGVLESKIPKPDLVLYLQAKEKFVMQRIRKGDRYYERGISSEYIQSLIEAYNHFYTHYHDSPVMIIDAEKTHLFQHERDREQLIGAIFELKAGLHYYDP
jgi:deoxyadenosine/deoxycytidine kinase